MQILRRKVAFDEESQFCRHLLQATAPDQMCKKHLSNGDVSFEKEKQTEKDGKIIHRKRQAEVLTTISEPEPAKEVSTEKTENIVKTEYATYDITEINNITPIKTPKRRGRPPKITQEKKPEQLPSGEKVPEKAKDPLLAEILGREIVEQEEIPKKKAETHMFDVSKIHQSIENGTIDKKIKSTE